MKGNIAIRVNHISKEYKLYDKKSDRLREALSLTSKQYYKPFVALHDISFEVKKGETVGIIGTNGSGKSTLLKILTGIIAPTSGSYDVNGKVSALLELGAGFNPEYTGLENIDLHATMMGFTEKEMEKRREEIVRFADIGDYISQPVKNYSSGMFARLAFAVAISIKPDILIVDEALSVGDVFFQNKCYRKFDELQQSGASILFVSHDTATVQKMCSRTLWIEHGEQKMLGSSYDVCTAYFNHRLEKMNEQNREYVRTLKSKDDRPKKTEISLRVPRVSVQADSRFSKDAEILSCYIKDANDQFTTVLEADQTYRLGIISKFHKEMDNVIVGFVLENAKGVQYLAGNTFADAMEQELHVEANTLMETEFELKMPRLRSGEYLISPAVAQGTQDAHVNLTWLHGALTVEHHRDGYEISEIGWELQVSNRLVSQITFFS